MSWKDKIKSSFEANTKDIFQSLKKEEEAAFSISGEDSLFLRFNQSKVRQTTSVEQAQVTFWLQLGKKLNRIAFPVTGDLQEDRRSFRFYTETARRELDSLPENPYPILFAQKETSEKDKGARFPKASELIETISQKTKSDDFVGYVSSGPLFRGMCNSHGTFHWYCQDLYFLDYSLFEDSRAVTALIAGHDWDEKSLSSSLMESREFLQKMRKPVREIPRGNYRVYLAPAAVSELASTMNWGGFSQAAFRQGQSGLRQLFSGESRLSEKLTLKDNYQLEIGPQFNSLGETAPTQLSLIEKGVGKNLLTSSKSASEYGVPSTGAEEGEAPRSLEISPGGLARDQILQKLGTGLYLSNLHYVNWSDTKSARLTGMTRFACFWVENGEIVAPIRDLRFDVSLYEVWGQNLVDLTQFQETQIDNLTYEFRRFGGKRVPGMLIDGFKFTL